MIVRLVIASAEIVMTTTVKLWLLATRRLINVQPLPTPLSASKRYVYVANHSSYLDPVVMWCALGFKQRLNGAPTKVMTTPGLYYSFARPIIWLLGSFPAKQRGNHKHAGIEGALHYLRHGYNICIFPEGKRALQSEQLAFRGVGHILRDSDDCEMILIHIIWGDGPWWKRTLELRAASAPSHVNRHDSQAIMKHIYTL